MDGCVFTTYGWLPEADVEKRVAVTADDEDKTVTRTDKHLRATGEWVGNDLHVALKKPLELCQSFTGQIGG